MKEEKITILIDEDGRIEADAENFTGEVCLKELEDILQGLPEIDDTDRKPEYYVKDAKVTRKTSVRR
ncbi:MAG: hypothetical protein Kow0069_17460 [Promethearchaeota archaeon]